MFLREVRPRLPILVSLLRGLSFEVLCCSAAYTLTVEWWSIRKLHGD